MRDALESYTSNKIKSYNPLSDNGDIDGDSDGGGNGDIDGDSDGDGEGDNDSDGNGRDAMSLC